MILAAAALVAAAGAWVLYHFDPTKFGFYPRCVFHALTGLDCPGCGATRAMFHLLHGDVAGAFRFNPALLLYLPVMMYGGFDLARTFVTRGVSRPITQKPSLAWGIAVTLVLWWIVRNTPLWPYRLPA